MQSTLESLAGRHIVSADNFNRHTLEDLVQLALELKRMSAAGHVFTELQGKVLGSLFFEPSSRTYFSFCAAMAKLGGSVVPLPIEASSVAKGETLTDTIQTVDASADVLVLRHPDKDAITQAASVAAHPVLNAGNGSGEHPTQALLDVVSITAEAGAIDGKTVVLVGDLKHGRTVHSLSRVLAKFKPQALVFVAPPSLEMPTSIVEEVQRAGIAVSTHSMLSQDVVQTADVIYVTRTQKERFPSTDAYEAVRGTYTVNTAIMRHAKPTCVVLHPLPRNEELSTDFDTDHRAAYMRQMNYGLYARMALLLVVLGKADGIARRLPPVIAAPPAPIDLSVSVLGHTFANPFMNAAGVYCMSAKDLDQMVASCSGSFITKSCTAVQRDGNPSPRYHELPLGSINSMGLPNEGYDYYHQYVANVDTTKPIFFSISGLTLEDSVAMAKKLEAHPRAKQVLLELNLSCPNVPGKPQIGYDMDSMRQYLSEVSKVYSRPFGVKMPPYFDIVHFDQAAAVLNEFDNVAFVTCINSVGNGLVIDDTTDTVVIKPKDGFGGIGGAYVLPTALANVNAFFRRCPKKAIIGCGGVTSGRDAYQHILAGASLVQVGTELARQGPAVLATYTQELTQALARKSRRSVAEARGQVMTL